MRNAEQKSFSSMGKMRNEKPNQGDNSAFRTPPPTFHKSGFRIQLFLSSALLSSVILIIAAWVINNQVVGQARRQVQAEVETLLPLYDAVWSQQNRRLANMGSAMANSPIVKTVFGDARASGDRDTLREMVADLKTEAVEPGDLILISDGAGHVMFAEQEAGEAPKVEQLAAARRAGETQTQGRSFTMLGDRLFHLVLTPVVLHSGRADYNNTLAVLGTGVELNAAVARSVGRLIHSEVIFFLGDRIYASSLNRNVESAALNAISARGIKNNIGQATPERPAEIDIGGDLYLAFARQLGDGDGENIGQVVVLRSLAGAGQLFRAVSNRLLLLWTLGIVAAFLLSYLIAGRITKPIESLAAGARELGRGNYEYPVPDYPRGEIGQLASAFNQMRQSIKQSQAALLKSERLATIGQMASSIIHDLRNPLATISTAAEVLNHENITPERRRTLIESQLRASERMSGMMTELLEFSRGSYKLNRQVQPLSEIVQRATQELNAQLAHLKIKLDIRIPARAIIEADTERMRRVFENILFNALEALPHGGAIGISAKSEDGFMRIDVIDDGPGVPPQIRERLFEPFVSQGKQGGTGLGLAIARGIVEAHGGRIGLVEGEARGAHFFIELPAGGGVDAEQNTAR
jgi:signal transduction histidine kinase